MKLSLCQAIGTNKLFSYRKLIFQRRTKNPPVINTQNVQQFEKYRLFRFRFTVSSTLKRYARISFMLIY